MGLGWSSVELNGSSHLVTPSVVGLNMGSDVAWMGLISGLWDGVMIYGRLNSYKPHIRHGGGGGGGGGGAGRDSGSVKWSRWVSLFSCSRMKGQTRPLESACVSRSGPNWKYR